MLIEYRMSRSMMESVLRMMEAGEILRMMRRARQTNCLIPVRLVRKLVISTLASSRSAMTAIAEPVEMSHCNAHQARHGCGSWRV